MSNAANTPEQADFIQLQYAFAGNIRDPQNVPPPTDVDERRMAVYRELFYNNIESLLAKAFPVLYELTPSPRWHEMVRDFFIRHRARTPFFPRLPGEFVQALPTLLRADDPPYLAELAHYEWIEMELALAEQEHAPPDTEGPLGPARLMFSPLARMLAFRYPVHRIGPDFQPAEPQPTHLLVYRDREDSVRFLEINAMTARLLEGIEEDPKCPVQERLLSMADELGRPDSSAVVEGGLRTLGELVERGVLSVLPTTIRGGE